MQLEKETLYNQQRLARFCRTGENTKLDGITPGRLKHYRRLVYNVFNNTLRQAFPIAKTVLEEEEWELLLNNFMQDQKIDDPRIWKMPESFYLFVKDNAWAEKLAKPWLSDLLLFEWTEIEIHTMADQKFPLYEPEGEIMYDPLVINPEHKILQLQYPVHSAQAEELEQKKGKYFLIVFREPESGRVKFIHLSALFIQIFLDISFNGKPLSEAAIHAAEIFSISDNLERVHRHSEMVFNDMRKQQLILGFNQNK